MRAALLVAAAALGTAALAGPAAAAPLTVGPVSVASTLASPFAPGCGGPGEAGPSSVNYANSEVEPHLAVNPTNGSVMVGGWQQDRWSDGGAHGNVYAFSTDAGATWTPSSPAFSRCAGGTATSARQGTTLAPRPSDYQRATDPWVSYGPAGRVHAIAIGFDNSTARNAILAAFSNDNGATWSAPRELRFDNPRALGNNFNDKETLTADPTDANLVYATWQRIVSPSEVSSGKAYENSLSWYSDAWFTRSTNGGVTWEAARSIFHPRGRHNQTIGNQVEVLPNGTLVNGFNFIQGVSNNDKQRGYNVAVLRSTNKGQTWSAEPIHVSRLLVDDVHDPDTGVGVRTGDIIPDFAVDFSNTATRGNLYAVWMDTRFNDPDHNDILLSRSRDGGRTWSAPTVVDQAPAGVDAFTATVDVDGAGRVAVSYYDFRNDVAGDGVLSTDLWVAHSHDGGQTFAAADETRMTPASFDMRTAPFARGYFVGDYTGLSHFGSRIDALWVDANDGNTANRTDVLHRSGQ
ncbi:MAG TPA: sialidase family protein [Solirubrobacteraceae bacterium]|nr:sialidase family protein [Solirubrobacteraceae bacterium]